MLSPIQVEYNLQSAEYYFATLMDQLVEETMQLEPVDSAFIQKVDELFYTIEAVRFFVDRGIFTENADCLAVYNLMMTQIGIFTTLPDLSEDQSLVIPGTNFTIPYIGPQGPQGPQGFQGPQGPQGSFPSGIANRLLRYVTSSTVGSSQIVDNGTNIGIGIGAPSEKLEVLGSIKSYGDIYANSLTVGRGGGNSTFNSAFGYSSFGNNTSGIENVAIGSTSLTLNTTGSSNTGIGYFVGPNLNTGNNNVFIGKLAGNGISSGSNNTIIGSNIAELPASTANNVILADGQGTIRYRWDGTANNIVGNLNAQGTLTVNTGSNSYSLPSYRGASGYVLKSSGGGFTQWVSSNAVTQKRGDTIDVLLTADYTTYEGTGGSYNFLLPPIADVGSGKLYTLKNLSPNNSNCGVLPSSPDTIDDPSVEVPGNVTIKYGQWITFVSYADNKWRLINSNPIPVFRNIYNITSSIASVTYNISLSDYFIYFTGSVASTAVLPLSSTCKGMEVMIKNISPSNTLLTVAAQSGDTIIPGGGTSLPSFTIANGANAYMLISVGTSWVLTQT